MKPKMKKALILIMAVVTLMTVLGSVSVFASTRSSFDVRNCCTVTISPKLMKQRKYKTASVKFKTHILRNSNRNSGGTVYISMYDEHGRHIWSGVKKGGDTLKFGNDHRVYKVYVNYYEIPESKWGTKNFNNRGKCAYWSFSKAKNCAIG